jgi:hypothetical protein
MRPHLFSAIAACALGGGFVASGFAGCGGDDGAIYDLFCLNGHPEHYNVTGDLDPCCCDGKCSVTDRDPVACIGQCPSAHPKCALNPGDPDVALNLCVPRLPGWSDPLWLWLGPVAATPPTCPEVMPNDTFDGTDMPTGAPAVCVGPCLCGQPVGSCLPTSITAYSDSSCTTFLAPFDPPPSWDGECTTEDAVPAGAGSVFIGPAILAETCAQPPPPTAQIPPIATTTLGRACAADFAQSCQQGEGRVPIAGAAPDFRICISHPGVVACPSGSDFNDPTLLYAGQPDDTRMCACSCAPSAAGTCTADVSIFPDADAGCDASNSHEQLIVGPAAHCYPYSYALAAKSATSFYTPAGSCAPSEIHPTGSVTGTDPVTFCCLPPPPPTQ